MTVILGIDPGLQHTGWGIISSQDQSLKFIACGTIHTKAKEPMAERLRHLHDGLAEVIALYKPQQAAIEETFMNNNARSALKLGQARGVLMVTVSLAGLDLAEYSATMIKKSVVGKGHADKNQMAMMVKTLLPKSNAADADAADALAIAICHAHYYSTTQKMESA